MRWLVLLVAAASCGTVPPPTGSVTIDGDSRSLVDCWASACGPNACAQAEGRDDAAKAISFDLSAGRLILYPPVGETGDVYFDGGCVESETTTTVDAYGYETTTTTCVRWDRQLFEQCWTGPYSYERDGPGSVYALADATLACEADGRVLTGTARCERGTGALGREHGL